MLGLFIMKSPNHLDLREYKLGIKEDKNNDVKIDKEFFQNI